MLKAPNLAIFGWLTHGFGQRDSVYPPGIITVKQVHSRIVLEAHLAGDGGTGSEIGGDGLVSNQPGVVVGVRTADCVPVLLADRKTRAVAAVHAGWRGTAGNIVAEAVRELRARFGSRPEDLAAAVGPAIGPCCYQVGPEVSREFEAWLPEVTRSDGPAYLDLPAVNELQLRAAGVTNLWKAGICTYCEARQYYSFRREKEQAGRMVSFIGTLRETTRTLRETIGTLPETAA